jgi:Protein of unknown function (DUF2510)
MTAPLPPPGWYPDPSESTGQRWWDGQSWSSATMPARVQPVAAAYLPDGGYGSPAGTAVVAPQNPGYVPYQPMPAAHRATARAQGGNRMALITFGIVAVYLVIAFETRFVIFGFLPLAMSLRSRRQREPLAPLAIAAAVLAILVAGVRIFGH